MPQGKAVADLAANTGIRHAVGLIVWAHQLNRTLRPRRLLNRSVNRPCRSPAKFSSKLPRLKFGCATDFVGQVHIPPLWLVTFLASSLHLAVSVVTLRRPPASILFYKLTALFNDHALLTRGEGSDPDTNLPEPPALKYPIRCNLINTRDVRHHG